jgi:hypothetical protein
MALSPVDFAAYSRATGAPYPESPEEKARMVPEVRAFRAGQLQQGESGGENNLLTGIGIGLGLLGAAGTGLALRGRRIPKMDPSGKGGIKVQANPSADKVYTQTPEGTRDLQRLNTKKVAPSNVVTEQQVVPDNFTETLGNFVSDVEAGRNPQRDGDFSGLATEDSGFRRFSERADDITEQARIQPQTFLDEQITTLTDTYEAIGEPAAQAQNIDAVQSSADQADSFLEKTIQRDTDSVRVGKAAVVQEEIVDGMTPRQRRLALETAPRTNLDSPKAKLKKASYEFEQMDMSGGLPDDQITAVGQAMAEARYDPTPSAYNLTGKTEDLPGVSEMSAKRRKEVFGSKRLPPRGAFSDSDLITREVAARPTEDSVRVAEETMYDVADRISAAASVDDPVIKARLLDPSVSTSAVKGMLGSTLAERRGRVGTNLTQELTEGARASMTRGGNEDEYVFGKRRVVNRSTGKVEEVPFFYKNRGRDDTDTELGARMSQLDENVVVVDERDPFVGKEMGQQFDPYGAEGLAGAEGIGTMVDTESYRERTNKGTTQIPGAVEAGTGIVDESDRFERAINQQLPVRRTEEGDPSRGYRVEGGRFRLAGEGKRNQPGGKIDTSFDINVEGSGSRGGFEVATGEPSATISTQPASRYRDYAEQVVRGDDGKLYIPQGNIVEGQEPLMGIRATITTDAQGNKGRTFLKTTKPEPVELPRAALEQYARDASYDYFNNPTAKREFLLQFNPQLLADGLAQGKTLSDIGNASTYNDFIIRNLRGKVRDNYGIDLGAPIQEEMQKQFDGKKSLLLGDFEGQSGERLHAGPAHAFINDLLKTTKEPAIYGVPALVDETGKAVRTPVTRKNTAYMEPVPLREEDVAGPIPGQYKTQGSGGLDPMELSNAEEFENVAYRSPRIQTAPQVVKDARTGQPITATPAATGSRGQVIAGVTGEKRQPKMATLPQLPQLQRTPVSIKPQTKERTVKVPGSDQTYQQTVITGPMLFKYGDQKTTRQPVLGSAGPELAGLRQQMEAAPQGLKVPYVSNVGGGFIANTKRPYTGYGFASYGDINQPVPQGTGGTRKVNLAQPSDPRRAAEVVANQQLNRAMVGEAAQRLRTAPVGTGLRKPDLNESDFIRKYGMGSAQLNRAASILANRSAQYTPPALPGQPTSFTYIPPTLK